jgi:hypothetical protein
MIPRNWLPSMVAGILAAGVAIAAWLVWIDL